LFFITEVLYHKNNFFRALHLTTHTNYTNAPIPAQAGILYVISVNYYVYILASKKNGILYVGFTSDLIKRTWSHKNKCADGFTSKYFVDKLVWFDMTTNKYSALNREKQIKKWNRQWKINLIEKENPEWRDLYDEITASGV